MQETRHHDIDHIKQKIDNWTNENQTHPFREAEAVQYLKQIEHKRRGKSIDEPEQLDHIESALLSLLCESRIERVEPDDLMTHRWLARALKLVPNSRKANQCFIIITMRKIKDYFNPIAFQHIRETDNSPAKKKLAEHYTGVSQRYLEDIMSIQQQMKDAVDSTKITNDHEANNRLRALLDIISQMEGHLRQLYSEAKAYQDAINRDFNTSYDLSLLKRIIDNIHSLKDEWIELLGNEEGEGESDTLAELNEMIGLNQVKSRVEKYYHFLRYQKQRKEKGFLFQDELSLNMILTGNPGTGKTTLARMLAKIYYELGVLDRPEVVEVNRSHLVGSYVGQTEEQTMNVVKSALGGVLFIDEAYSLRREGSSGNDYGMTAVDTLVSAMTNSEYAGKFAVILAGYPDEMRQFLWSNPGLRSRFPEQNHIHIQEYSTDELVEIAEKIARDNDFVITKEAAGKLRTRIENEKVDETFGNARTVKNIVLDAVFEKGASIDTSDDLSIDDYTILNENDFESGLTEENYQEKSPMKELESLVGLEDMKQEVKTLTSFFETQQLRRQKGLPVVPVQLHSVFSGNPGTGKTTVAKLYSRILKETGLLKRGHLVVTGRADLVAGYVGQTAIKTKKKVREALGGVLFIDEAYALAGSTGQDFGREALDTLVDEMAKHDENLVVIIAGYPSEMENLLAKNPGLQSRFQKHFHFSDYTIGQLVEIARNYAKKRGYDVDDSVPDYLLESMTRSPEGNGRFAVNLVDEAIQQHAFRIMNQTKVQDKKSLSLLKEEDLKAAIHKLQR